MDTSSYRAGRGVKGDPQPVRKPRFPAPSPPYACGVTVPPLVARAPFQNSVRKCIHTTVFDTDNIESTKEVRVEPAWRRLVRGSRSTSEGKREGTFEPVMEGAETDLKKRIGS